MLGRFFWYGYSWDANVELPPEIPHVRAHSPSSRSSDTLLRRGIECLQTAVDSVLEDVRSDVVIPLSGGLDSRAILGATLRRLPAADIITYTYGSPGTADFELGNQVAKLFGTRHHVYDLTTYRYDLDVLLELARRTRTAADVFQHAPYRIIESEIGIDKPFLSGFMGEAISGAHLPERSTRTWKDACQRFAKWNYFSRPIALSPPGYDPVADLPTEPLTPSEVLGYDDQLDFAIRQQYYIRPLVLLNGQCHLTPFLHSDWLRFMLTGPRERRASRSLYKAVLSTGYPRLFSIPTKSHWHLPLTASRSRLFIRRARMRIQRQSRRYIPRLRRRPSVETSYIDFADGIRTRSDLQRVMSDALHSLMSRRVIDWLDIASIWKRHQERHADYSHALQLLASLEIHIHAGTMRTDRLAP